MRQGAFLNISFEPPLIKSPNLANCKIYARATILRNQLINFEDWGKFHVLFNLATCTNYSITNYVTISVFGFFFEKANKEHLKISAIKDGQISLHYHFNKIIKRPGTSFQSTVLIQKYVRNVCHTAHLYSKEIRIGTTSIM